jgi:hypothetical protein
VNRSYGLDEKYMKLLKYCFFIGLNTFKEILMSVFYELTF